MENKRLSWIDVLKGIGIIFVVLGHTHILFREYIYSFHMPLFFFISGYLFISNKYGLVEFFKKKFKTILVPYIFLSFLSIIISFVVSNQEADVSVTFKELVLSTRNHISINQTLWFLTTLFIVEILFYTLSLIFKSNYLKSILIIALSVIGFYTLSEPRLPLSIDSSLYYLLFYLIGNMTKNIKVLENKKTFNVLSSICLTVSSILIVYPSGYNYIASKFSMCFYLNFGFSIFIAMLGILACVKLSFMFEKSDKLAYLGKNSLTIFALHIFFLDGVFYFLTACGLNVNQGYNIYAVCVTVLCLILFIPITNFMNKYFYRFLGK